MMLCSQSVPEWCGEQAKLLCRAGSRGGQCLSQGCLHPWGPPRHLVAALAPTPRTAGKEHLVMESDGKLIFFTPWPICITWANSWRGRALRGTPHICRNPGFDFSNMQTICRQLQLWEQGRRDALEPSSPLVSWRGPLERPRVLTERIACTRPCGPTYLRPHSWTGCWGKTCLELGDLLDTSAKPNSPPTGSHSRPVCPVCSSPRGTMGTTCTIPPQLHWD